MALLAGSGCGPLFQVSRPEGFVLLKKKENLRVFVAPDNSLLAVRAWRNKPKGDLGFWAQVVERDFVKVRGYKLVKVSDVTVASGRRGKLFHFQGAFHGGMYDYFLALFVGKGHIVTAELLCLARRTERYRKAFDQAVASLRFLGRSEDFVLRLRWRQAVSHHELFEFLAVDEPLDEEAQAELRQ